jgi:hypothetical protein
MVRSPDMGTTETRGEDLNERRLSGRGREEGKETKVRSGNGRPSVPCHEKSTKLLKSGGHVIINERMYL